MPPILQRGARSYRCVTKTNGMIGRSCSRRSVWPGAARTFVWHTASRRAIDWNKRREATPSQPHAQVRYG
jgi:hypothetical protein